MELEKKGYESESGFPDEGDVFAAEVKAWFLDGVKAVVGAIVALVLIFAASFLQGCGSNGSDSNRYFDQSGNCPVKNCVPCPSCGYFREGECQTDLCNSDASVLPEDGYIVAGDSCNNDTCSAQPQYDTVIGACEAIKAGKKPPEVCTPKKYKDPYCWCPDAPECQGFPSGCNWEDDDNPKPKPCSSDAECQVVPCEAWPPEVCWGLPCMLVGKWDCDGYINDLTDAEFYDNGDGYCRIHSPADPNDDLYYKPGDDHVQRPPSGEPVEEKYTVLDGGSQLKGDGSAGTFNCTKLVEE